MNELKDLDEQDKQNTTNVKKNKRVKKWEKRWILVPNVFQFGQDVWVHKWVNDQQIFESNELLKKKQDTNETKSPSRVVEIKIDEEKEEKIEENPKIDEFEQEQPVEKKIKDRSSVL